MENLGILRSFSPEEIVKTLISERKAGWRPDRRNTDMDNMIKFFERYTLGRNPEPFTMQEERVPGGVQVTMVNCFGKYVGFRASGVGAKQMAAHIFLQEPEVCEISKLLPPTQKDIRQKCDMHTTERRLCRSNRVSGDVMNGIVRKRMDSVMAVFHQKKYRCDLWDGHA